MEQIIKKAIEGGWMTFNKDDTQKEKDYKVKVFLENPCQVVMQQSFWQALGKACGWVKSVTAWNREKKETILTDDWKINALKFHEINLTENWDKAVEYLKEITN